MRHLVDLEQGIREVEEKIRRLQSENTELIRELCEIRAENKEWQDRQSSRKPGRPNDRSTTKSQRRSPPSSTRGADRVKSASKNDTDDTGSLYEPFAAMWNLIRLDPSVVQGTVSAETVFDRLRAMVESESRRSSLLSVSESEEDDSAEMEKRPG
jgi:hypothetical protein